MTNQYSVAEFVEAFKQFYQTIDVRAALLKHENQWRIVCTALRIHIASSSIIEREFKKLKTRYGKMVSPRFRIIQHCYSFSEFERVVDVFSKGHLMLGDLEIPMDEKKDILELRGDIPWFSGSDDKPTIANWPVLRAQVRLSDRSKFNQLLQGDQEILRYTAVSGYTDPYAAIRELLEINFDSSTDSILVVEAEVPARIDSIKADRTGTDAIRLNIHVMAHRTLSGLSCAIRQGPSLPQQLSSQKVITLNRGRVRGYLRKLDGKVDVISSVDNQVEVELVYKDLGRLYSQGIHPIKLLRIEERNPLFMTLTHFCPWEQVKDLLERPEVMQVPNNVKQLSLKNKGKLHEVSIQWLLSILGLRAIWLHGYEKMEIDKYDYGSIDCLAYHELRNVLLLVNCTTGPPNQHEMNRQMELQRRLSEETFHNTAVRLYSVVFTASHRPGIKQGIFTDANVRIFYREDIPKLLKLVNSGKEVQFIDAIINPLSRHW